MREDAQKEIDRGCLSVEKPLDNSRLLDALVKAGDASSGQEKIASRLAKSSLTRMSAFAEKLTAVSGELMAGVDYSSVEKKRGSRSDVRRSQDLPKGECRGERRPHLAGGLW
ncbi:MAG: hypothetical protein QNL33_01150 [Akkermansiaceae bacterium]|jgi:hypothetical protein